MHSLVRSMKYIDEVCIKTELNFIPLSSIFIHFYGFRLLKADRDREWCVHEHLLSYWVCLSECQSKMNIICSSWNCHWERMCVCLCVSTHSLYWIIFKMENVYTLHCNSRSVFLMPFDSRKFCNIKLITKFHE